MSKIYKMPKCVEPINTILHKMPKDVVPHTKTFWLFFALLFYSILLISLLPASWGSFLGLRVAALFFLHHLGFFAWGIPPFFWIFEKQRQAVPHDEILFLIIGYLLLGMVFFAFFPTLGGATSQAEQQWLSQHFSSGTRIFFLICLMFIGFFLAIPHPNAPHPVTRHLPLLSRTIFPSRYLLPPLSLLTVNDPPKLSLQQLENIRNLLHVFQLPSQGLREEPDTEDWKCFSLIATPEEGQLLLAHTENLSLQAPGIRIFYPLPTQPSRVGIQVPMLTKKILRYSDFVSEKQPLPIPLSVWVLGSSIASGERILLDLNQPILVTGNVKGELSLLLKSFFLSLWVHQNPLQMRVFFCDLSENFEINAQEPHFLAPVLHHPTQIRALFQWLIKKAQAGEPKNDEKWIVIVDGFEMVQDLFPEVMSLLQQPDRKIVPMLWVHHPTPQVITAELKEGYPQRICLKVNSSFDSRMVLERNGAEELKGHGDFYLFRKTSEAILRGQSISVDTSEWNQIQNYWLAQGVAQWHSELTNLQGPEEETSQDPYLEKAVRLVLSTHRISSSFLMNRLQIDINDAEKLLLLMEKEKIIARKGNQFFPLMTLKEWEENPPSALGTRKS